MYAGQWIARHVWNRSPDSTFLPRCGLFGVGVFLGTTTVSLWQQWTLTFGQDPLFVFAIGVMLMVGMLAAARSQSTASHSTPRTLFNATLYLCLWSILFPYWLDALTAFFGLLPLSALEGPLTKLVVAFCLAAVGWTITGSLWSGLIGQAVSFGVSKNTSFRRTLALVVCGAAFGQLTSSLALSAWFGAYIPVIVMGILSCVLSWRAKTITMSIDAAAPATDGQSNRPISVMRSVLIVCVGLLYACALRLSNQLLPHGSQVFFVECSGVLLGFTAGLLLGKFRRSDADNTSWCGLVAAACTALLLAVYPHLVTLGLRMNASFTLVSLLLAGRTLLLIAIAFPYGFSLSLLSDRNGRNTPNALMSWCSMFVAGAGLGAYFLAGHVSLMTLMMTATAITVLCSLGSRFSSEGLRFTWKATPTLVCLSLAALSLPLWSSNDNPARSAKLLYSTPTFIAYRSGWSLDHLPYLDEIRMIDRREGNIGPLTLWRGHVAELYLREAGIPRSVVTMASESVPQFAPESLQVIYSLCLAERPGRVLFLGLSGGVPLSTSLNFPIREAVCFEGNEALIDLVRGPISQATGVAALSDDRVTLHPVAPELAVMTKADEPFDVVISSPPPSSLTDGVAHFTTEFYHRAARQLADRGLFCQRFEGIDYGPEPLQLALKAMQSAFKNVIAIETSPGEFLLVASHSDNAIVSGEFVERLQAKHVRKLLARSGIDWSTVLNQPVYDDAALREVTAESRHTANSTVNGILAARAPFEVMRWGNKRQEVQDVFASTRLTPAPFWANKDEDSNEHGREIHLSRRSQLFEWLDISDLPQEFHRRLGEMVTQQKLVRENPDAHWWAYRKALRKQLQENPRTAIRQVRAISQSEQEHPEDVYRQEYFKALGAAARQEKPTRDQISVIESFLEPYDPFISYFARQETADLLARSDLDPAKELEYRLHVIYFAPQNDASVRNVATAIETLVKHPDVIPDDSLRFDALGGLIQTLRVRWEIRQSIPEKSSTKVLEDIDQSLVAVEKGVGMMNQLASTAGVATSDWQSRRSVLDRLLILPLRTYRIAMHDRQTRGQAEARAILNEAADLDDE